MNLARNLLQRANCSAIRSPLRAQRFSNVSLLALKALPPRLVLDETELEENFLKGSGPGGQKINKTNSAVQLKHLPSGIVVKCQETRSRTQNRKIARQILADQLDEIEKGDSSRVALKKQAAAKKKASRAKKARRKYRALDEKRKADFDGDTETEVNENEAQHNDNLEKAAHSKEECGGHSLASEQRPSGLHESR